MMQADHTPSRAFPRALLCPICPPVHGGDLQVLLVEVDHPVAPRRVDIGHTCRRCGHGFTLRYAVREGIRWEFSLQIGPCPPSCTVVHGLYAGDVSPSTTL